MEKIFSILFFIREQSVLGLRIKGEVRVLSWLVCRLTAHILHVLDRNLRNIVSSKKNFPIFFPPPPPPSTDVSHRISLLTRTLARQRHW